MKVQWQTALILPPKGVDVFVKLADGSFSVGYVGGRNKLLPANVEGICDGDIADVIEFNPDPVAWALIPEDF
jgi:hypothetical protein